jgi:hypothetical protein
LDDYGNESSRRADRRAAIDTAALSPQSVERLALNVQFRGEKSNDTEYHD